MDLNKKLEELKPYQLNCNVFDVYSYNGLTMQDLLCQFFTKINECITVSNETIDLAKWLVNEGLEIEVVKKLMIWLEDGTLENIINVNLFNTLNEKINGHSSQLEHIENKLDNCIYSNDFKNYDESDDGLKINRAISYAIANNKQYVIIDSINNVYSDINIFSEKVSLIGVNNARIKLFNNAKINITANPFSDTYEHFKKSCIQKNENIIFEGIETDCILNIQSDDSCLFMTNFSNCVFDLKSNGDLIKIGSNTWGTTFDKCYLQGNYKTGNDATGVHVLPLCTNYGEKISFVNSIFDGLTKAIYVQSISADVHLENCSIDYCKQAVYNETGCVYIVNSFIEANSSNEAFRTRWFENTGRDSHTFIDNCRIIDAGTFPCNYNRGEVYAWNNNQTSVFVMTNSNFAQPIVTTQMSTPFFQGADYLDGKGEVGTAIIKNCTQVTYNDRALIKWSNFKSVTDFILETTLTFGELAPIHTAEVNYEEIQLNCPGVMPGDLVEITTQSGIEPGVILQAFCYEDKLCIRAFNLTPQNISVLNRKYNIVIKKFRDDYGDLYKK